MQTKKWAGVAQVVEQVSGLTPDSSSPTCAHN